VTIGTTDARSAAFSSEREFEPILAAEVGHLVHVADANQSASATSASSAAASVIEDGGHRVHTTDSSNKNKPALAKLSFSDIVKLPVRVRKPGKKSSNLPSNRLTSDEHYAFVAQKSKKSVKEPKKGKSNGRVSKSKTVTKKQSKRRKLSAEKTSSSKDESSGDHTLVAFAETL